MRFDNLDFARTANAGFDAGHQFFAAGFSFGDACGLTAFNLDCQFVHPVWTGDFQCEVWRQGVDFQCDLFDLGRENIDAAQNDHVIGPTGNATHATVTGAGRSWFQAGEVVGSEANNGECFTGQGGEDQLAFLIISQWSPADGVDDFWAEVIFPDVATILGIDSFPSDSGTHELGQAVNIAGFQVVELFDFVTHTFGPRLRTQDREL